MVTRRTSRNSVAPSESAFFEEKREHVAQEQTVLQCNNSLKSFLTFLVRLCVKTKMNKLTN